MLEHDDVDRCCEGAVGEWQLGEVGHRVEAAIVPCNIADGEIDADVAAVSEVALVLAFAGTGIEQSRARRQCGCELQQATFGRNFKAQHKATQPERHALHQAAMPGGVLWLLHGAEV